MGDQEGLVRQKRKKKEKTTGATTPINTSSSIRVKVTQVGRDLKVLDVPRGSTVAKAIEKAGFSVGKLQIQVNGRNAKLSKKLKEGDIVVLISKTKLGE